MNFSCEIESMHKTFHVCVKMSPCNDPPYITSLIMYIPTLQYLSYISTFILFILTDSAIMASEFNNHFTPITK